MSEIERIRVDAVKVGDGHRKVDPKVVADLAESYHQQAEALAVRRQNGWPPRRARQLLDQDGAGSAIDAEIRGRAMSGRRSCDKDNRAEQAIVSLQGRDFTGERAPLSGIPLQRRAEAAICDCVEQHRGHVWHFAAGDPLFHFAGRNRALGKLSVAVLAAGVIDEFVEHRKLFPIADDTMIGQQIKLQRRTEAAISELVRKHGGEVWTPHGSDPLMRVAGRDRALCELSVAVLAAWIIDELAS